MAKFAYKAKDVKGGNVRGIIEAGDEKQARSILKERALFCFYLSSKEDSQISLFVKKHLKKINFADITAYTRQLATMINAGLPLTEALTVLKSQESSMSEIAGTVLLDVKEGKSLTESIKRYPKIFSSVYIALVSAGEAAGILDNILNRLADTLESQREFQGKIKNAMIYPVIVLLAMLGVIFGMMVLVIPKLNDLYKEFDADLPATTKALIAVSGFFSRFWWLMLILIGGGVYLFKRLMKNKDIKRKVDEFSLKIPIVGKLSKMVTMTEFTRTLGLLVGAGVSLVESLKISSQTSNNLLIEEAILFSAGEVEKGMRLSTVFSQIEYFPSIVGQMIAVGEETGKMDEVLTKVSNFFQTESEQAIKGLTTALEPLIMIVLGVGVLFLILAIIMPIYNLTSTIK